MCRFRNTYIERLFYFLRNSNHTIKIYNSLHFIKKHKFSKNVINITFHAPFLYVAKGKPLREGVGLLPQHNYNSDRLWNCNGQLFLFRVKVSKSEASDRYRLHVYTYAGPSSCIRRSYFRWGNFSREVSWIQVLLVLFNIYKVEGYVTLFFSCSILKGFFCWWHHVL